MKGIELSKKYFEEFGFKLLKESFADILPFLAVGLVGSGSECFGFDDSLSQDHDFEPAFCIFLPNEDIIDDKTAFALERAYAKLPKSFMGFKREPLCAVGGNRHGVMRIGDFFEAKTGSRDGSLSLADWFCVPEFSLCEAVNGEVFLDNYGEFTKIRERLSYFPEDIRLKKLAGNLLLMGQSGQYNYNRCISRGDSAAAQLCAFEFVKSCIHSIFLINKTYMPYYKWQFKALKALPRLSHLSEKLEFLISSANSSAEAPKKSRLIEEICDAVAKELKQPHLTECEQLAYLINNSITDNNIRNMHILSAVE